MEGPLRRQCPGCRQGPSIGRNPGGPRSRWRQQVCSAGRRSGSLPAGAGRPAWSHGRARNVLLQRTRVCEGRLLRQQRVSRSECACSGASRGSGGRARRESCGSSPRGSPDSQSCAPGTHSATDSGGQTPRDEISNLVGRRTARQQRHGGSFRDFHGSRHDGRSGVCYDVCPDESTRDGHTYRNRSQQQPRHEHDGGRRHHGRRRIERRRGR
mmetsp:Transcript_83/g.196  ORF Transcript_83/g.196 Transcript_83/m.196 type:complete len:212 (-) Transcript_83:318-953(-)